MPKTKSSKKAEAQNTSMQAATWGIVAAAVVIVVGGIFLLSRQSGNASSTPVPINGGSAANASSAGTPNPCAGAKGPGTTVTTASGLQYEDLVLGTCAEALKGKQITVHYVGTLTNGTKFDSSRDRNEPFPFTLGAGQVIAGWDEGIVGMKVGGIRRLTIPPGLAYGDAGSPPAVPPNATLIFEVELLDVQ